MNQQINLYQPIFRKQKAIFSALAMLQVWGIIVLVMGAISAYTAVSLSRLEAQVTQGQKLKKVTQDNVAQLRARQLAQTPSKLLEAEVKRLRIDLAERRQIGQLLSKGALSNTTGFSAQFIGLAQRHAAGSWLTEISLREGGTWINLRGVTLAPEIVATYMQSILDSDAFVSARFNVVQLQAAPDWQGRTWFEIGTAEKEPGEPLVLNQSEKDRSREDAVAGITRRTN